MPISITAKIGQIWASHIDIARVLPDGDGGAGRARTDDPRIIGTGWEYPFLSFDVGLCRLKYVHVVYVLPASNPHY